MTVSSEGAPPLPTEEKGSVSSLPSALSQADFEGAIVEHARNLAHQWTADGAAIPLVSARMRAALTVFILAADLTGHGRGVVKRTTIGLLKSLPLIREVPRASTD